MNGFQFVSRADGDVDGLTVAEARAAQSQTPTLPKGWAGVSRLLTEPWWGDLSFGAGRT